MLTHKPRTSPPPTAPKTPYMAVSFLYYRVDKLQDLPPGRHLRADPQTGLLRPFYTDNVPADKLADAVAEGRVYAIYGMRRSDMEELHPDWPSRAWDAHGEVYGP